jgi:hypothetical protein
MSAFWSAVTRFTGATRALCQGGGTSDWMVRAGLIEKTMSKTSTLGHSANDYRALEDTEVDAVTGGTLNKAPKLYDACCKGTHIPEVVIESRS